MSGNDNESGTDHTCDECTCPQQGDFVRLVLTGWRGQIVDRRVLGFNDPEYRVRVFNGTMFFVEWFSLCEIEPDDDDPEEEDVGTLAENVIPVDFTKRTRLEDAEPKGAA